MINAQSKDDIFNIVYTVVQVAGKEIKSSLSIGVIKTCFILPLLHGSLRQQDAQFSPLPWHSVPASSDLEGLP